MVMKINVSIPEDLLLELDQVARQVGTTRSALLAQAVRHYLKQRDEEQQRQRRQQAAKRITEIAEQIGPWDATAEVLKWREKH